MSMSIHPGTLRNTLPGTLRGSHATMQQLLLSGGAAAAPIPFLIFNGTTTVINHGNDSALNDMQDGEVTFEIWIKALGAGENNLGRFFDKGNHFVMWYQGGLGARCQVDCATTDADSSNSGFSVDSEWHHVVCYFNDAGDRKVYVAVDGIWNTPSIAGVGAIVSDADDDLSVGNRASDTARTWDGHIGWYRFSNNDRYNHGMDFTPPGRGAYPSSDANTILLCHVDEGEGATLDNEQGDANRDGTITNGTWGSE